MGKDLCDKVNKKLMFGVIGVLTLIGVGSANYFVPLWNKNNFEQKVKQEVVDYFDGKEDGINNLTENQKASMRLFMGVSPRDSNYALTQKDYDGVYENVQRMKEKK